MPRAPLKPVPAQSDDSALRELLVHARERVTPVRLAVLRALASSTAALDATEVAAALSSSKHTSKSGTKGAAKPKPSPVAADRVTVYRTLTTLVEAGLAHKIDAGDRVFRYSLTDHSRCGHGHHHHEHPHIVCESCGTVECLTDAEVVIRTREGSKPITSPRFRVKSQEVMLRGVCGRCDVDRDGRGREATE